MIVTNRLIIRPIKDGDVEEIYEYTKDRSINMMFDFPHESINETKEFVLDSIKQWQLDNPIDRRFVVVLNEKIIGGINTRYYKEDNYYEIGWIIHSDYRKQGYATEAAQAFIDYLFNTLNAKKIVAHCDIRNKSSEKVMIKLNMKLYSDDGIRCYPKTREISKELTYILTK